MATLNQQLTAIRRAIEILEEIYPARILQKKVTPSGAKIHIQWLTEAYNTLAKK